MDSGAMHTCVDVLCKEILVDGVSNLYRTGLSGKVCVLHHSPCEYEHGLEPLSDCCSQSQKEICLSDMIKWGVRCCG